MYQPIKRNFLIVGLTGIVFGALAGPSAHALSVEDATFGFEAFLGAGDDYTLFENDLFLAETAFQDGNPDRFGQVEAETVNGAMRMRLTGSAATAHRLHGNVRDQYTIVGDMPGTAVDITAHLRVDGTYSNPGPVAAGATARGFAQIGGDLGAISTSPLAQSPHINNLGFGTIQATMFDQTLNPGESQNFAFELSVPLVGLEVGETFSLAYRIVFSVVNAMTIDASNTVTVAFDLPPGTSLLSQNGFGTAPVPLPGALLLFGGAAGLLGTVARRGSSRTRG